MCDSGPPTPPTAHATSVSGRLRPAEAAAITGLLGLEELVGLALANRPTAATAAPPRPPGVLVAETASLPPAVPAGTRIETAGRHPGPTATPGDPGIRYREDDGAWERLAASARLLLTRPRAVLADRAACTGGPPLSQLAPVLARIGDAEITAAADPASQRLAARLRALRR